MRGRRGAAAGGRAVIGRWHSRRTAFQALLEAEVKNSVWDQKSKWGVYYWKIIRYGLYHAILRQIGLSQTRVREGAQPKSVSRWLFKGLLRSALLSHRKVEAVVLEFPRKLMMNAPEFDPYTAPLIEELRETNTPLLLIQQRGKRQAAPAPERRYVGESILEKLIRLRICLLGDPVDRATQERINAVLADLSQALGTTIMYDETRRKLIDFELQRRIWKWIFKRTKCKDLYLVCSYGKEGVIAAAQDFGVRVTELQHGTIVKYHPGYSFGRSTVPYFPDRLFVFGEKWCGSFLPLGLDACRVFGYRLLNRHVENAPIPARRNAIVFLSQWTVNEKLLEFARSLHEARSDLPIIFKFHPGENDSTLQRARASLPGIHFVKTEEHLYHVLSRARFVVGVFSTSVLEALALGCTVVLVDTPGVEVIEDIISDLHLPVVSSAKELASALDRPDSLAWRSERIHHWFHGCRRL